MLYDVTRHEALQPLAWNEDLARATIRRVVSDTESRYSAERYWPIHPRDVEDGETGDELATTLYYGACGVIWALHYLQAVGAAGLSRSYVDDLERLRTRNRAWLESAGSQDFASFLMGDTPIELLAYGLEPDPKRADRLAALIAGNLEHPARELLWGAPGTLLAALFLHERTGNARWADLFRQTAAKLRSQLLWSPIPCGPATPALRSTFGTVCARKPRSRRWTSSTNESGGGGGSGAIPALRTAPAFVKGRSRLLNLGVGSPAADFPQRPVNSATSSLASALPNTSRSQYGLGRHLPAKCSTKARTLLEISLRDGNTANK